MSDKSMELNRTVFPEIGRSGMFWMEMYRGEGINEVEKRLRGFASDPGDYGRGEYWTDSPLYAQTYGTVRKKIIELKNALRLDPNTIAPLIRDEYEMTKTWLPKEERLASVDRFTRDMQARGYDGIVILGYELPDIWSACVFTSS